MRPRTRVRGGRWSAGHPGSIEHSCGNSRYGARDGGAASYRIAWKAALPAQVTSYAYGPPTFRFDPTPSGTGCRRPSAQRGDRRDGEHELGALRRRTCEDGTVEDVAVEKRGVPQSARAAALSGPVRQGARPRHDRGAALTPRPHREMAGPALAVVSCHRQFASRCHRQRVRRRA